MHITLDYTLTPAGVECRESSLGKIATIEHTKPDGNEHDKERARRGSWYVFPYAYPPYDRGAVFLSLDGAKAYALALAYDMHHEGRTKNNG